MAQQFLDAEFKEGQVVKYIVIQSVATRWLCSCCDCVPASTTVICDANVVASEAKVMAAPVPAEPAVVTKVAARWPARRRRQRGMGNNYTVETLVIKSMLENANKLLDDLRWGGVGLHVLCGSQSPLLPSDVQRDVLVEHGVETKLDEATFGVAIAPKLKTRPVVDRMAVQREFKELCAHVAARRRRMFDEQKWKATFDEDGNLREGVTSVPDGPAAFVRGATEMEGDSLYDSLNGQDDDDDDDDDDDYFDYYYSDSLSDTYWDDFKLNGIEEASSQVSDESSDSY